MTPSTAVFLRSVLDGLTLSVGAPDFAETAAAVTVAMRELDALIAGDAPPDMD